MTFAKKVGGEIKEYSKFADKHYTLHCKILGFKVDPLTACAAGATLNPINLQHRVYILRQRGEGGQKNQQDCGRHVWKPPQPSRRETGAIHSKERGKTGGEERGCTCS